MYQLQGPSDPLLYSPEFARDYLKSKKGPIVLAVNCIFQITVEGATRLAGDLTRTQTEKKNGEIKGFWPTSLLEKIYS